MTATIKPPDRGSLSRRPLRFSSLESLGFSDANSVWSDSRSVAAAPARRRGRHEAPEPEPDTVADLRPEDFGGRLTGGNIRWGLVVTIVVLLAGLTGVAFWLYQRPAALHEASAADLTSRATALHESLPVLQQLNDDLLTMDPSTGMSSLFAVESDARALFEASVGLADSQSDLRRASSEAAGSALDGVRLVTETHSYRAAVLPILVTPELETDPAVIELDEAARFFGDWQLAFDNVRTALPESVMSNVTQQLDVFSGDLSSILTQYVDALREDDMSAAQAVVSDLETRLGEIDQVLEGSIKEIQARVSTRIDETRQALERLLDS